MNPRFPIFIPSKSRWDSRLTMRHLDVIDCPYRVIVEAGEQYDNYARHIDPAKLLVLDPAYIANYQTHDADGDAKAISKGSGPARNFAWDTAIKEGFSHHWIIDDNIAGFFRLNRNQKKAMGDATHFYVMEDFVLRYRNIAMAGPNYIAFAPRKNKLPPIVFNTRIYSCILIDNAIPFRWRCRYNEDTDLSLRVLKAGYCTIEFNAFLQMKIATQKMKGGNMEAFYASEGTLPKSQQLKRLHPDVCKIVRKYGRWHHHVNYNVFAKNRLLPQAVDRSSGRQAVDEYGLELLDEPYRAPKLD